MATLPVDGRPHPEKQSVKAPMTKARAAEIFYAYNIQEVRKLEGPIPPEMLSQVQGSLREDFAKFCTSDEEVWAFIDYLINDINHVETQ